MSTAACRIEEHGRRRPGVSIPERRFERAAEILTAAGEVGRMRVLVVLAAGPTHVSAIADSLGLRLAHVSQQLGVLREASLVRARRRGKTVVYSLADDHVRVLVEMAVACAGKVRR